MSNYWFIIIAISRKLEAKRNRLAGSLTSMGRWQSAKRYQTRWVWRCGEGFMDGNMSHVKRRGLRDCCRIEVGRSGSKWVSHLPHHQSHFTWGKHHDGNRVRKINICRKCQNSPSWAAQKAGYRAWFHLQHHRFDLRHRQWGTCSGSPKKAFKPFWKSNITRHH